MPRFASALVTLVATLGVFLGTPDAPVPTTIQVLTLTGTAPPAAMFSPNGRYIITGDLNGVVLRDSRSLRIVKRFTSDRGAGPLVALSGDGRLLATGSPRGMIVLFDVPSGRPFAELRPIAQTYARRELDDQNVEVSSVGALAMSADGGLIAAAENVGQVYGSKYFSWSSTVVHVWDVKTRRRVALLRGHEAPRAEPAKIISLAFDSQGRILATGGEDGTARLWLARTGRLIATLNHKGRSPHTLIFTRSGRQLITATSDHVRVWNLTSGRASIRAASRSGLETFDSLALDPSERFFAVGQADNLIRFWGLESGRVLRTLGQKHQWSWVTVVAFSPDGRSLLAAATGSAAPNVSIQLWRLSPK